MLSVVYWLRPVLFILLESWRPSSLVRECRAPNQHMSNKINSYLVQSSVSSLVSYRMDQLLCAHFKMWMSCLCPMVLLDNCLNSNSCWWSNLRFWIGPCFEYSSFLGKSVLLNQEDDVSCCNQGHLWTLSSLLIDKIQLNSWKSHSKRCQIRSLHALNGQIRPLILSFRPYRLNWMSPWLFIWIVLSLRFGLCHQQIRQDLRPDFRGMEVSHYWGLTIKYTQKRSYHLFLMFYWISFDLNWHIGSFHQRNQLFPF